MALSIEFAKYLDTLKTWEKNEEDRPKVFADSRWSWRYEQAERRKRFARLAEPLASNLDRALTGLQKTLNGFSWPGSRLSLDLQRSASPDPALEGRLSARVNDAADANRFYKFFSRGLDKNAQSPVDAGDYRFDVSLGGETETVHVSVGASDTWGDVLSKTAAAVNGLKLPVQAGIVTQHNPYQKIDDLGKTGSILALGVEPARADQDLKVMDTQGLLAKRLDFTAPPAPALPAGTREYSLTAPADAEPTLFRSQGRDPGAQAGVSEGTHKIGYAIGGESGTFDIDLESDMTWAEVLQETAAVINSTSAKVQARVVDSRISSGLSNPLFMDGKTLEISARDPKLGERLSLSEYGGPWLDPVTEFFDPVGTTPATPQTGDRYVALSTANGWTKDNVYEWDGSSWAETVPVAGNALFSGDESADYFYDGSGWSVTPTGGVLGDLGLKNPKPGMDAELLVDNTASKSATGAFAEDRGRLELQVEDSFGERLPLRVVGTMDKLAADFDAVIQAYNGLQVVLEPNTDLFRDDVIKDWRDTVDDNRAELAWLGIEPVGDEGLIMADADRFWYAVGSDPERAKSLLLDEDDGLFTAWGELTEAALSPDASKSLLSEPYIKDLAAPVGRMFANEKRSALQQVIDAELGEDSPNATANMEMEILKAVADAPTELERLLGEHGLDTPGGIFKAKG